MHNNKITVQTQCLDSHNEMVDAPGKNSLYYEVHEFREVEEYDADALELPMDQEYRKCTDIFCLVIFIMAILNGVACVVICLVCVDLNHYKPHDQCGNFCGIVNKFYEVAPCSGMDYINKKILQYDRNLEEYKMPISSQCVTKCNDTFVYCGEVCWPKSKRKDGKEPRCSTVTAWHDIKSETKKYFWVFFYVVVLMVVYCFGVILILQFYPLYFLWGCLIICAAAYFGLISLFGFLYVVHEKISYLIIALMLLLIGIIPIIILVCYRKYIELAALLVTETSKIFMAMPGLIAVGLTICVLEAVIIMWTVFMATYLVTCQNLEPWPFHAGFYRYVIQPKALYSIAWIAFINFWAQWSLIGCMYVIFGIAISSWYFTMDKEDVDQPIRTSLYMCFRFHLGSCVFGGLIVTLFEGLRSFLQQCSKPRCSKCMLTICFACFGAIIKYMTVMAYIQVGINGQSFCKSGKRAFQLIMSNAFKLVAVKFALSYTMFTVGTIISLIAGMSVYILVGNWLVVMIAFVFGLIISGFFAHVFSVINDCLFMCYFEDTAGNYAPPYYTDDFRIFLEKSKPIVGERKPQEAVIP